jgi:hypothetical protein
LCRHRGNADVVRQELASEKGIAVSLRTVYRPDLEAEARATVSPHGVRKAVIGSGYHGGTRTRTAVSDSRV